MFSRDSDFIFYRSIEEWRWIAGLYSSLPFTPHTGSKVEMNQKLIAASLGLVSLFIVGPFLTLRPFEWALWHAGHMVHIYVSKRVAAPFLLAPSDNRRSKEYLLRHLKQDLHATDLTSVYQLLKPIYRQGLGNSVLLHIFPSVERKGTGPRLFFPCDEWRPWSQKKPPSSVRSEPMVIL